MRRFVLLSGALLLSITVLHSPTVRTQQPTQSKLPTPDDYPAADTTCKSKMKLNAKVTGRAIKFPDTGECQLAVYGCDGEKIYSSGEKTAEELGTCAPYYKAGDALQNREVCCDSKSTSPESKAGTREEKKPPCEANTPPWFDTDGPCDDPMFHPVPMVRAESTIVGVTCAITYHVCDSIILQWREEFFPAGILNRRSMPREEALKFCASKGFGRETVPYRLTCCKKWRQAIADWLAFRRQHGPDAPGHPCNPSFDADCDGKYNLQDPTPLGDCAKYPASQSSSP